MIVVYEKLDDIHGYYHDGMVHINESIPDYLKEHVKAYLEKCHERSPELKVYYMRCIETDPEVFRELYGDWDGMDIESYMSEHDIADIARRMRGKYPEYAVDDDIEMIRSICSICRSGTV